MHPCARIARRLTRASVSKKGEAKRGHTKWPDSSGGVTRWPRQHCAQSSPRVGAVLVCRVCFLNNRQEIIVFEVSPLWSIWKTRRAASHCPRWNALMLPRFHFVDCGLYCAGFEAAIIVAQLFLFQRHEPTNTSRAVPRTEHLMNILTQRITWSHLTEHSWVIETFHNRIHVWIKQNNVRDCNNT